jgi:SAM-dependent methyltransferase
MAKRRVINVGGNSKAIRIPACYDAFEHLLLDIDPTGGPDLVCDAREMENLEAGQADAVYCSHNLEHYYPHDVPRVLAGFLHVLTPEGFAEIRVPDLGALITEVARRGLDIEDVLYTSPAGPVRVRDVIYGFAPKIEQSGQDFYAHRTGFTETSLAAALMRAGFRYILRRPGRPWELSVLAFRQNPVAWQQQLLDLRQPVMGAGR